MDSRKTGELIKEIRIEKNMKQKDLADRLFVSVAAVSKWENGHSLPDISLLELLAAALDIPIADIVTGERSIADMEKQTETGSALDHGETVIRSVLDESVRQRKKSVAKWVAISLGAAALLIGCLLFLLNVGFKARQEDVRVRTEIQDGWNGNPEWVIHFETVDGRPLFARTQDVSTPAEDGDYAVSGRMIHLRIAPIGRMDPGSFTWGYSVEGGLAPKEDYDFFVIVDYADGQVRYSMREEGLFTEYGDDSGKAALSP